MIRLANREGECNKEPLYIVAPVSSVCTSQSRFNENDRAELFYRMRTSPSDPIDTSFWYSSVLAS
jgi:hypothetical protein